MVCRLGNSDNGAALDFARVSWIHALVVLRSFFSSSSSSSSSSSPPPPPPSPPPPGYLS